MRKDHKGHEDRKISRKDAKPQRFGLSKRAAKGDWRLVDCELGGSVPPGQYGFDFNSLRFSTAFRATHLRTFAPLRLCVRFFRLRPQWR
jgi:hypothetical protein